MLPSDLPLVPFAPVHLEAALALSRAVGWPHRAEDWALALATGRGLVALEGAAPVGTILWWQLESDWATLGLVIVAPGMQGRGLGRRLMAAALDTLEGRGVLLNGTLAGLPLYRSLGFAPLGEVRQLQGVARPIGAGAETAGLRAMRLGDLEAVIELDGRASGLPRGRILRALIPESEGLVLERAGALRGYALCRRFGRGLLVGPLIAPDAGAALGLIDAWIARGPAGAEAFLRLDVPLESGLSDQLAARGLAGAGDVVTMVRGHAPQPDPTGPRNFALASQAWG